jgi:hypothetical protein
MFERRPTRRPIATRLLAIVLPALATFGLMICVASPAAAQEKKKSVRVSLKGEVLGVSPGIIRAKAEGKPYLLKVNQDRNTLTITGTIPSDQLKAGLIVRCTGKLKGNALDEELTELTVHTAADGYQANVLQDGPDEPATIIGRLTRVKDKSLVIAAGRKTISARLADDAKILVDTKDYSVLKGGEAVHFDGQVASDGKTVGCRKITITIGQTAE